MTRRTLLAMAAPFSGICGLLAFTSASPAAPVPLAPADANGFHWATVESVNNPAYTGTATENWFKNRGSVDHAYRISQEEVSSGQWLEFYNAVQSTPGLPAWLSNAFMPDQWGAYHANKPNWRDMPMSGVTWRQCAAYCNWLCNDKAPGAASFLNGAYDTSTFGGSASTGFTDQLAHTPGAKYWIPTLDEWMKAAYYDPTKNGTGGWWQFPNMTDDHQPVPGFAGPSPNPAIVPGFADTDTATGNLGITDQLWEQSLGAYPQTASYYGLLDASGGASEWTESVIYGFPYNGQPTARAIIDSEVASLGPHPSVPLDRDRIGGFSWEADEPDSSIHGFRIAAVVPAPGEGAVLLGLSSIVALDRKRERRSSC